MRRPLNPVCPNSRLATRLRIWRDTPRRADTAARIRPVIGSQTGPPQPPGVGLWYNCARTKWRNADLPAEDYFASKRPDGDFRTGAAADGGGIADGGLHPRQHGRCAGDGGSGIDAGCRGGDAGRAHANPYAYTIPHAPAYGAGRCAGNGNGGADAGFHGSDSSRPHGIPYTRTVPYAPAFGAGRCAGNGNGGTDAGCHISDSSRPRVIPYALSFGTGRCAGNGDGGTDAGLRGSDADRTHSDT